MTFGAFEHLFSWYSFLHDRIIQAQLCKWEIGSWFFYITTLHLAQIYKFLPVNILTVIWAEYMNVSFTFSWNFIDLFIMIMSFAIASKFKMINERLELFRGKIVVDAFWDEIRSHYNKICELNEHVDDILGSLICISCLSDLYYVCLQLLNVATPLPFLANKIYFWYSTVFLICRTSAMFLTSASINDESIKPLSVFRSIPSEGWTQEVQRFCNQIQNNGVALSGKHFFFLTRSIVISIAGTILTYELVLLQFDGEKIVSVMFDPCEHVANSSAMQTLIQN
ncbi:gustatory receptor for sugar taste 64a-like [Chironomus tepperi]|uniref:gustatory receptor for sugar taste 64a-like n=1 Tax=Chironomus tepperi TaxID=113505 RepID=UPI00391FBE75